MKLEMFNERIYDLNKMTDEEKNNLFNTFSKLTPKEKVINWLKTLKNDNIYLIKYLDLSKNKYDSVCVAGAGDKIIEYFENNKVAIYYIYDLGENYKEE